MKTITYEELVAALTQIYKAYADEPHNFDPYGDPAEDATHTANNIFEIVKEKHD